VRKFIARIMRKAANKLDPPPRVEPATPLEFIPTPDLALEIRKRNDSSILYWGRRINKGGVFEIDGCFYWSIKADEIEAIFTKILSDIEKSLPNNGEHL
jgi:hypothetical protein